MTFEKKHINRRVVRSSKMPIVDLGMPGDEASVGLQHGDGGVITDVHDNGSLSVVWDKALEQGPYFYRGSGQYVELADGPKINNSFDLSKCCSCPRLNEYDNDANCDDGWRCGECRVIRSFRQ